MSFHNEQKGNDLHEPSNARIINSTGNQLLIGTWVFLGADENTDGFIVVSRIAAANERIVGLVTNENISTNATGVVTTFGRIRFDTTSFSVGDELRLSSSSAFAVATDHTHLIGIVITSASNGTIEIDTKSIPAAAGTGGATTLNGLNDVTISNLQVGDILVNDAGTFKNEQPVDTTVTVTGTAKQITATTVGTAVTISSALGDVDVTTTVPTDDQVLTYDNTNSEWVPKTPAEAGVTTLAALTDVNVSSDLRHNDILEYDITDTTWKNKPVPTGVAETLEELIDVHIEDRSGGKTIISEIAEAFVDIEAANNAIELYGLDTSNGLLIVAPEGDTPIDTIHLTVRRGESQNSIGYAVTSNELLVQSDFISSNPTLDNIYANVVEAFNDTNFVDGVRTIDGKEYHRVGDWTNPTNPRHVPGETATGSQTFTLKAIATFTDAVRMDFTILSPLGHFTRTILLTNVNYNQNDDASRTIALTNLVNQMVAGLNANADFSNIYTASSNVGVLIITADAEGAASNGTFGFRILDTNDINGNRSSNTLPSYGQFNVNGGQDIIDSLTTLRWTNTGNSHLITRPTPLEQTVLYFKQGGFDWTDTDFALRNLTDIGENTEEFPQMLIRPNAISDFNYTDVRIQNLDVINRAEKFKQGTLLQYANGNVLWEYCGLADDGTVDSNNRVNFFKEPEENQFLVYNFRGGLDPQWTARFPLMSDVASVVNEEIGSVLISPDGTGFQAENATPSEMFIELGNTDNETFGILPLLSPRYDSTYSFTTGNNFFAVRATGSYEFQLALTKNFQQASGTTSNITENISFFVTKNGSNVVVDGNEWAHPANSTNNSLTAISGNFQVPRNDGTFPNSLGASIASCSPLIIDLSAGDTIQIKFNFANLGVIGLTMSNGQQGKSWCRVKRVQ